MPSNTLFFLFYIFIIKNIKVYSQLCTETKMIWREVPETYTYTYLEAYEKTNCLFWCTDSRMATAVGTRKIRKQVTEKINVCCQGYTEEKSFTANSFYCKPICSMSCLNGFCKSPEVCACNPGYLPDISELHKCNPMCIKDCEHGTCVAPNICECNSGYISMAGICEPICHEPCDSGTCIAPNTCQCHPGYKKSDYGICEPYCSNYTATGECVVSITCEPGWKKNFEGQFETCKPVCTFPCIDGKCISPDVCECFQGYKKSDSNNCKPYCSSGCAQGICVSPENCICEPGWFKKELDGPCLPHCDHSCGNGTCVAPNICECFPGYKFEASKILDKKLSNALCVPICEDCEGYCVAPEKCICEWPWESVWVTDEGQMCDCLNNCSTTDYKCSKTICKLAPTTTSNEVTSYNIEDTTNLFFITAEVNSVNSKSDDLDNSEGKINKVSWLSSTWIYWIGCTLIILIVIVIAAVILKKYSKTSKSNNGEVSPVVHYKQTSSS